jgi:hypothetical protein|tara:strand:+ start:304 stop:606 length:303 start_codon:yes stop_codon:yes gene_type:complete
MSIVILASLGVFTLISVITLLVLVLGARSRVSKLDKSLSKLEETVKKHKLLGAAVELNGDKVNLITDNVASVTNTVNSLDAEMGALLVWVHNADDIIDWG